jgi:hypothetical protein
VLAGGIPLFDRHNDAQILTLFLGSFAAGMMTLSLIKEVRSRKED